MAELRGTVGGPVVTEHFGTPALHKLEVYEANGTGGWKTAAASVTSGLPRFSKAATSTSTR